MDYYDYKAIPAPRRSKKSKKVREPSELFALTLTETLNEQARDGWDYVRAETLPAETARGFFRRASAEEVTLLIFRRLRESREPRLESPERDQVEAATAPHAAQKQRPEPTLATTRSFEERVQAASLARREPRVTEAGNVSMGEFNSPLRAAPKLDPAEHS